MILLPLSQMRLNWHHIYCRSRKVWSVTPWLCAHFGQPSNRPRPGTPFWHGLVEWDSHDMYFCSHYSVRRPTDRRLGRLAVVRAPQKRSVGRQVKCGLVWQVYKPLWPPLDLWLATNWCVLVTFLVAWLSVCWFSACILFWTLQWPSPWCALWGWVTPPAPHARVCQTKDV